MKLGAKTITIKTIKDDFDRAVCANRRQCVFAHTFDRVFDLGGKGYIRVDANAAALTNSGMRYRYSPTRSMLTCVRTFDRIGATKGVAAARAAMKPSTYTLHLISATEIPPKVSRKRKDQINAARAAQRAEQRARGVYQKPQPRYVGV